MRTFTTLLLALALGGASASAQEDVGKMVKSGAKALAKYTADATDEAALAEARSTADAAIAVDGAEADDLADAYLLRGNAYAAEVNDVGGEMLRLTTEAQLQGTGAPDLAELELPIDASAKAIESFQEAYARYEKGRDKTKAVQGMQGLAQSLSSISNALLGATRYEDAYAPLKQLNDINEFYLANDEEPLYPDEAQAQQQKYITAIVANQAGDVETALSLFDELYVAEYDEANVYAGYAQALIADGQEDKGLEVLGAGRERYSDNSDILFAEINYYITKQDFATLERKLQEAIAKEPDNVGLYTALGNTYMNLSTDSTSTPEQSDEYMAKSISYYNQALERDADNVDATYSIGSLYFNKAVAKTTEMNNLGTSKADQQRYDQLNTEINDLFAEALPYFEKAETMDPDDRNTLIALKEIYARQNDFEKSNAYKDRLESLGGR